MVTLADILRQLTELESDLDDATPLIGDGPRVPATPENRVKHALLSLKREREARINVGERHT